MSDRHYAGLGIGLYIVHSLVDAMGGRIFLEPNGYASSRFVVALPGHLSARI